MCFHVRIIHDRTCFTHIGPFPGGCPGTTAPSPPSAPSPPRNALHANFQADPVVSALPRFTRARRRSSSGRLLVRVCILACVPTCERTREGPRKTATYVLEPPTDPCITNLCTTLAGLVIPPRPKADTAAPSRLIMGTLGIRSPSSTRPPIGGTQSHRTPILRSQAARPTLKGDANEKEQEPTASAQEPPPPARPPP